MDGYYNLISVTFNNDKKLEIKNPTDLPLVGQGRQGAVFKIDNNRCIKIYPNEEIAEKEKSAYLRTIGSPIMPLLYETGPRYIVIEYINGPNLKDYLLKKGRMPKHIVQELINMFYEMKRLNFLRRDESLRHILIKDNKKVKIVDHFYAFSLKDPVPVKMFKQLNEIGMLNEFIKQGFDLAPLLFNKFSGEMPEFFENRLKGNRR